MARKIFAVLFAAALLLGYLGTVQAAEYKTPAQLVEEAKAAVKEVSADALKKMIDRGEDIVVLDIRDRDEYEKKHIPGAIHMSRGLADLHLHEIVPDKKTRLVVY